MSNPSQYGHILSIKELVERSKNPEDLVKELTGSDKPTKRKSWWKDFIYSAKLRLFKLFSRKPKIEFSPASHSGSWDNEIKSFHRTYKSIKEKELAAANQNNAILNKIYKALRVEPEGMSYEGEVLKPSRFLHVDMPIQSGDWEVVDNEGKVIGGTNYSPLAIDEKTGEVLMDIGGNNLMVRQQEGTQIRYKANTDHFLTYFPNLIKSERLKKFAENYKK